MFNTSPAARYGAAELSWIGSSSRHRDYGNICSFDAEFFEEPRADLPCVTIGLMLPGKISEWHRLSVNRDDEKVHVIKLPDDDGLMPLFFEGTEDFQVTSACFSHESFADQYIHLN